MSYLGPYVQIRLAGGGETCLFWWRVEGCLFTGWVAHKARVGRLFETPPSPRFSRPLPPLKSPSVPTNTFFHTATKQTNDDGRDDCHPPITEWGCRLERARVERGRRLAHRGLFLGRRRSPGPRRQHRHLRRALPGRQRTPSHPPTVRYHRRR